MRVSLGRVLCSALPALLVFASVGVSFSSARAGEPFVTPLCGNASTIVGFFAESADFSGLENCESLCKKARAKCKEFLSKSKSCEKAAINDFTFFEKEQECDPLADKSARKECQQAVKATADLIKDGIKDEDETARDACDGIGDECIADCGQS